MTTPTLPQRSAACLNATSPNLNRLDAIFTTVAARDAYYARCRRLGYIMSCRDHRCYASWAFAGY